MAKCFHCHKTAAPGYMFCGMHLKALQRIDTTPPAPTTEPTEVERLRTEQAAGVMPQIGPLLDAWDGMLNDTKALIHEEAPGLARALGAINRAMESDTEPTEKPLTEALAAGIITDCDQAFEEHYKCSARDPSNAGDLAIWRAAWAAKGGQQ